jgi:hypothetical protein
MRPYLRLVPDPTELGDEARLALCAEAICNEGGPVYRVLRSEAEAAREDGLHQTIKRLSDRDLGAAGMYAASERDSFIGSLITFEEGRRLGVLQSTTTTGGSAA